MVDEILTHSLSFLGHSWKWEGTFSTFEGIHYFLLCRSKWLLYKEWELKETSKFHWFHPHILFTFYKALCKTVLYIHFIIYSLVLFTRPMRQHSPNRKKSLPCLYYTSVEMWHTWWQSWHRIHGKLNLSPCHDLCCLTTLRNWMSVLWYNK